MKGRTNNEDWQARMRYRPSQAEVARLVAWCRSTGEDPTTACVDRWGDVPAGLLRRAPELRGRKGRGGPGPGA